MSTHLATSLFRFCLVGLLAAARLLCPCVAVEVAQAAQPQHRSEHSCCDESASNDRSGHHDAGHPHGNGCEHCPDTPQIKSLTVESAGVLVAWASLPAITPELILPSVAALAPYKSLTKLAAHPPQTVAFLRTVILLI